MCPDPDMLFYLCNQTWAWLDLVIDQLKYGRFLDYHIL
jgi:hypothetical protein